MNDPQNPYPYQDQPLQPAPIQQVPEKPSPEPDHRGKGKIARLPKKVRDQINQMIDDGLPYGQIIQQLGEFGIGLSEKNISNWKNGRHQAWLNQQERLDRMRVRQEFAMDLVREDGGATTRQAAFQIAGLQLCDLLDDFDSVFLKET